MILDEKRFPTHLLPEPAFGNVEYKVLFTMSTTKDKRIMSFVDTLWGFEVTGGYDQYEPLTVLTVRRSGYARRAGIRVNDTIVQINDTPADSLTLREAQLLIRQSGKQVKIYVKGDVDNDSDDEYTVDFWFKPPKKKIYVENKWGDCFPWNDRKKKIYRESNCFMVPSKAEDKLIERMLSGRGPIEITEAKENKVDSFEEISRRQRLAAGERELADSLRAHTPTTDEANITSTNTNQTNESNTTDSVGKSR
ncbi:PDZ and LIM domain protein 2 [Pseudolycoriella hygida]|uniref:PDZ and LIM domain protein 2 n=1 Tax=Pseudolycoriella hygida TaxID=35572 RepID=A0A9Q0RY00_9DIPT|nr:PDZ and LIM domain protein 2 [Pseudolycoriella hygida]